MHIPPKLPQASVLGVPIQAISHEQALDQIAGWIDAKHAKWCALCTVYNVMLCRENAEYAQAIKSADLILPDGMPLVWACQRVGYSQTTRVYGPDLMLQLSERGLKRGYKHYYYGSTQQTLDALQVNLETRFPGLKVVGSCSPPFRPLSTDEDLAVIEAINHADPDIVWVGLGTPKQDLWMFTHRSRLQAPVLIGVGAAFKIHAGFLPQAPHWMRRMGAEWLFRLIVEPRRLWRRYLIYNPLFVYHLLLEIWATRKRQSDMMRND